MFCRQLVITTRHSCSVKHLAAKNIVVNDLSKSPVINVPIMQVPSWSMVPFLYLRCAILLLHSCMFGVWQAVSRTSLRYYFHPRGASDVRVTAIIVCLCVTCRYCIKTSKRRIMQTTPRDSPETLVFWCQNSLVEDPPLPLETCTQSDPPLSNRTISTNICSQRL